MESTMTPEQMQMVGGGILAFLGWFFIIIVLMCVVGYLIWALCVAIIAKKLGMPFGTSLLMAIIPIANLVLLAQMAKKPIWWILLMLFPITSLAIYVIVWEVIAGRMGKPAEWGTYIMLIPVANLVYFFMLVFADAPAAKKA